MSRIISLENLRRLAADFIAGGGRAAAPLEIDGGRAFYHYLTPETAQNAVLRGDLRAANSVKEFFFPRSEALYAYLRKGNDVEISDAPEWSAPQLVLGCRPCEAASLPILDPIFAWDYQDRFWQSRREKTTVVSVACTSADADCFCSSVGGSPENTAGTDAILYDLGDGAFEVRTLTEKGEKLFDGKTAESDKTGKACEPPQKTFDPERVRVWLDGHFGDEFWAAETLACVGCGACTYTCPTCHCFDIVDRGSFQHGERVKNWDFCQSALFTLHASGHNPRPDQAARQRQRISHKFSIYPEKFGAILCTGCGNCSRKCPVALGVRPLLERIEKRKDQE